MTENQILEPDGIDFLEIDEDSDQGKDILSALSEESVSKLGYFLKPSELFSSLATRGAKPDEFILDDLTRMLNGIERPTFNPMGGKRLALDMGSFIPNTMK